MEKCSKRLDWRNRHWPCWHGRLIRRWGLESYFTAGEKEVRAWTIPVGATGPEAAGVIHTDFEKGFIRAEVFTVEDLEEYGSEVEIKKAGKMRVEGKAYVVQDGDICHFRIG